LSEVTVDVHVPAPASRCAVMIVDPDRHTRQYLCSCLASSLQTGFRIVLVPVLEMLCSMLVGWPIGFDARSSVSLYV
jgi:hypothetical protein